MSDIVYEADVRIERVRGPDRRAFIPAHDGAVAFGVHGQIAEHYGVRPRTETSTTLDYVIAATGG